MPTNPRPELLAPAGNNESLIAAVENGCDAVYLGATTLSARASAANFAPAELADAIDYAHLRGVKTYVAVNTLVKDSETDDAAALLRHLDESGADAVIVQDIGLLSMARSLAPDLPVHASTQMTVHNSEGAGFLQDMGVKRVVLAREMTLDEIKQVRQNTGIEIEIFVHGALCISYSGQCLASSMIGGRSGNRGVCAQPCRKRYRLRTRPGGREVKTGGEYLLSPKDLNTSRILPELIEAGIDSFKIEGRLKRPEYVACVARIYRGLIDRYVKDPSDYFVTGDESQSLAQVFNRGFTAGYLTGNPHGELMSRRRPHNRGIPIGTVIGCEQNRLRIRLSGTLCIGDGIGIAGAAGAGAGVGAEGAGVGDGADGSGSGAIVRQMCVVDGRQVDRADGGAVVDIALMTSDAHVHAGSTVYKTLDKPLMDSLKGSFTSPTPLRRIPVTIIAEAAVGSPLGLRIEDDNDNAVHIHSEYVIERAVSRPTTREEITRQLAKLGNTVFEASESDINLRIEGGGDIFIPVSQLNRIRSDAVSRLADARIARWRRGACARHQHDRPAGSAGTIRAAEPQPQAADTSKRSPPAVSLAVSVSDMDCLISAIAGGADVVYLGGERFRGVKADVDAEAEAFDLETATEYVHQSGRRIYLNTPKIASDSQMRGVADSISGALRFGADGVLVSNHGAFRLAEEMGLDIVVDSPLNVFNRMSLRFWAERGAGLVTLSPELTLAEIRKIAKYGTVECIVHGRLTLMESEHCVVGGMLGGADSCTVPCEDGGFELVDEKGYAFPLMMDTDCRMHLLNSSELCMLDHVPAVVRAGVSSIRIDARWFESGRAGAITRLYRDALDGCSARDGKIQSTCKGITGEYTTGHYRRGVL
ncbi:MAG: peptidase U32 [Candidatus Methanogaster sp.]|uniref:Peptidase U32 n=1 Tax=Candidatus Methanogaster sp. TaxID=3386292 RepID=A0AC61L1R6_9EURY|nr:MAG: peptidase U32 [ANME-2 cluster archaeon]